jgi:hypothetical protein
MDATALGALLLGVGAVLTAAVTYLGKRAELATTRADSTSARINRELDQVQEERDGLRRLLQERDARITELLEERLADQVEMARLRVRLIERGEEP